MIWKSADDSAPLNRPLLLWAKPKAYPAEPNDYRAVVGMRRGPPAEGWSESLHGEELRVQYWMELPDPPKETA